MYIKNKSGFVDDTGFIGAGIEKDVRGLPPDTVVKYGVYLLGATNTKYYFYVTESEEDAEKELNRYFEAKIAGVKCFNCSSNKG